MNTTSTGRHPVETGQLVMGIAFLTFVVIWGGYQLDWWDPEVSRYLMPVPWVLGGLIGLIALAISSRRKTEARDREQARARTAAAAAAEEEFQRRERVQPTETMPHPTEPLDETAPLTLGEDPGNGPSSTDPTTGRDPS